MHMATIAEKPRKQAISGRFWAGRTYRGRIKDDHKIERFFSLGKRCNGMGLITTRLEETSVTVISLSILVTNLFRHTDAIYFFVFYLTNETDEPERYFALFDVDEDELWA